MLYIVFLFPHSLKTVLEWMKLIFDFQGIFYLVVFITPSFDHFLLQIGRNNNFEAVFCVLQIYQCILYLPTWFQSQVTLIQDVMREWLLFTRLPMIIFYSFLGSSLNWYNFGWFNLIQIGIPWSKSAPFWDNQQLTQHIFNDCHKEY